MARSTSAAPPIIRASQAVLVLVLLIGTVATSSNGLPVSCENQCQKSIVVNGVTVAAQAKATVEVAGVVNIEVEDATKVLLTGSFSCPADVTALLLVYEEGCVKVKVAAVAIISKLLHTVVGLVLGLIACIL